MDPTYKEAKKSCNHHRKIFYLGVDPGKNGAAVLLDKLGNVLKILDFSKLTTKDVSDEMKDLSNAVNFAILEKVHSRPRDGRASAFKFGEAYGTIKALLVAYNIKFEEVSPLKWMNYLHCRTGGDKKVTREAAQRLFPDHKWTLKTADAVLIAEYCRQIRLTIQDGENK